jgi:hypothetical protein
MHSAGRPDGQSRAKNFAPIVTIKEEIQPDPLDELREQLLRIWRPQGDSNPCYRRERAVS